MWKINLENLEFSTAEIGHKKALFPTSIIHLSTYVLLLLQQTATKTAK